MDPERTEELLRERARRNAAEPLGPGASERLKAALAAEREATQPGTARARPHRGLWLVAGSVAAAALLWFLVPRTDSTQRTDPLSLGALAVEVAMLDSTGRELETTARGSAQPAPRPDSVLIELLSESGGFLWVYTFDHQGVRRAVETRPLPAGEAVVSSHDLTPYAPGPDGGPLTFLLVTAERDTPPFATGDPITARIPLRLRQASGPERAAELRALADSIEAQFGCSATWRDVPPGSGD